MEPSKADISVTDQLAKLCGMMEVHLYDHVIVGPGEEYYSFYRKGILPLPKVEVTDDLEKISLGGMNVAENTVERENIAFNSKDYYEMKKAELKEITDKLEQGVAEIFASDRYKEMLDMLAKFPEYSANNAILIMLQKPDAQLCQSYTGWKGMGRYVKKGERGIKILAPTPYTIQRDVPKLDENGNRVYDKDGEPVMETVEFRATGYKVVNTFDISQTDGKELPTIGVEELTGDVDGYGRMQKVLVDICPVPIAFEKIDGAAKGYYHQVEKRIAIKEGMSEVQTVKTLIHDMAHQKLHAVEHADKEQTRNSKEVEAESVAYTVCQHYGIDTSDYSFSYVVGWSQDKEMPELKESLETIRKTAAEMIRAIDEKLEELTVQKEQEQTVGEEKEINADTGAKDRKKAYGKLVSETAKQCSADAKKEDIQTPEKSASEKKPSVRKKLQTEKEKAAKAPVKKTKEREVAVCV